MPDLVTLAGWHPDDLSALFDRADQYREARGPVGRGAVGLLFSAAPPVTAAALECAAGLLGLQPISLSPELPGCSGEDLIEVLAELSQWIDALVISDPGLESLLHGTTLGAPVVNAGSASGRPCEVLAELYAVHCTGRDPLAQRIVVVAPRGPLVSSWAQARTSFGLDIWQACPDEVSDPGLPHNSNLFAALSGAGLVVTVDPGSLAEEMAHYRIESEYLVVTAPDCLVSPQLPFRWGRELAVQLRDDPQGWVGPHFRRHGVALYQALLARCVGWS